MSGCPQYHQRSDSVVKKEIVKASRSVSTGVFYRRFVRGIPQAYPLFPTLTLLYEVSHSWKTNTFKEKIPRAYAQKWHASRMTRWGAVLVFGLKAMSDVAQCKDQCRT